MSTKNRYKFMSVFMPVSALSIAFVVRPLALFVTENFSEKSSIIILFVFFFVMMAYVFGMAFTVDRMRKKYYADESYWQPEVLKLPDDCETVDSLKDELKNKSLILFL